MALQTDGGLGGLLGAGKDDVGCFVGKESREWKYFSGLSSSSTFPRCTSFRTAPLLTTSFRTVPLVTILLERDQKTPLYSNGVYITILL